jgi:hypothetical protein
MIIGLSTATFTLIHVIISLIGIAAGIIVFVGLLRSEPRPGWTAIFLIFTILTSATGFLFPITGPTPALIVGVISLVILAVALLALYGFHTIHAWRWVYVLTAILALWFNCFVLLAQAFQKIPALSALAPTQSEPPFLIAQSFMLLAFLVFGYLAVRRFYPRHATRL